MSGNRVKMGCCGIVAGCFFVAGCGPTPPKVVLNAPADMPAEVGGRKLFHTPQAYIYARDEMKAGEADRFVTVVREYIKSKYDRELEKGLIIVRDPSDESPAKSLEEMIDLDKNRTLFPTQPRHKKSLEETRKKMADEGIPEAAAIRMASVPMLREKQPEFASMRRDISWEISAPSNELIRECAVEIMTEVLQKKLPKLSEEQARKLAKDNCDSAAQEMQKTRENPVFILWVERQKDWNDTERCNAILRYLKKKTRAQLPFFVPMPKDEEFEW